MNDTISHKTILLNLIGLLSVRHCNNDFNDEYQRIISEIAEQLKNTRFVVAGKDDRIKIAIDEIISKMADVSSFVSLIINKYLKGEITDANWVFKKHWEKNQMPYYDDIMDNRVFFRMRKKKDEEKDYVPSDLLHIPLSLRNKTVNQRFSINGFPCLYASTSLYQCWEELRRPHIQILFAAGLLFNNNLKLFDLRLIRAINNEKQLKAFLVRLPLIIACSIKTIDDKSSFKPEYIISQILLHYLINKKHNLDGIIYSSMRKDYDYFNAAHNPEECSKNENIVIPAKVTLDGNIFVDNLKELINISEPLSFEQEIIKGTIGFQETKQYNNSIFGQMEKLIMSANVYNATNTDVITSKTMVQQYNDLNSIFYIL